LKQLGIEVLYNLRCESRESMFDLKAVVVYICQRVGMSAGRVWFGAGMAINAKLTATQRRNFLRFLNRHNLRHYLVLDDFHKKQPVRPCVGNDPACPCQDGDACHYRGPNAWPARAMDIPGRMESRGADSAV
jgi:hypothetical protein